MAEPNEKINVLITMDFSDDIIERIRQISPKLNVIQHSPDVPENIWKDVEVLYTARALPEPALVPRLRWIQLHSAGVDTVLNHPIIQAEDVEVTSASGVHGTPIAEYCLTMMLAFAYKLPHMLDLQSRAEWPENKMDIFKPIGLRGATLGIMGYGTIGRELARMAAALGMTVLASKRNVMHPEDDSGYSEPGLGDPDGSIPERLYPAEALASMAKDCDYLVITAPLTPQTRHAVNEAVLKAMKNSAVLINIARGGLVDEAALISALAAGEIAGAALDVFEQEPLPKTSPLWNMDNVILSPHVSGNVASYYDKAAAIFIENLHRYLENRPLLNLLDRTHGY